jgi:hypothetical protein
MGTRSSSAAFLRPFDLGESAEPRADAVWGRHLLAPTRSADLGYSVRRRPARLGLRDSHERDLGKWVLGASGSVSRRGGRAVEGSGLENRQSESSRGFESHPLRQSTGFSWGLAARSRLREPGPRPRNPPLHPLVPPWGSSDRGGESACKIVMFLPRGEVAEWLKARPC